ncbi:MAG: beta-ketoacyl-ACP synthase [Pseudomonadota bacterium]
MTSAATAQIGIPAATLVTCLGRGRAAHLAAMSAGRSGLEPLEDPLVPFDAYVGRVSGLEGDPPPAAHAAYDNRATRIVMAALGSDGFGDAIAGARARWGARRIGIVVGTSTSGVERLETCYRQRDADGRLPVSYSLRHHNDHQAVAAFLQAHLALEGPSYSISTACSSSAKALLDATQLIEAEICDAVLVAGIDSLCMTSLAGFEALELISRTPCRPCDAARDGISIGEGAGLMLIERGYDGGARMLGSGESSDGVNMSTPPVDGRGAQAAMRAALADAGIEADAVGFVNLHGTATPANDSAECTAVLDCFGAEMPVASFKGAIGHTLGAAGAVEIVLCLIALEARTAFPNAGLEILDPAIGCNVMRRSAPLGRPRIMTNAFGFGGNNSSILLGE